MSVKTILITEPADPLLHKLAIRFSQKPHVRLVCFDGANTERLEHGLQMLNTAQGEVRSRDSECVSVDEIWHTRSPEHSLEESRQRTERVLSFAGNEGIPVVHYVSALSVAVCRRELTEAPSKIAGPMYSDEEQCHLWNEEAVERSGCRFRIYRLPLIADRMLQSTSVWVRFAQLLRRFKDEIEDRIPGYFTAHPLRLDLDDGAAIDVARMDDVAHVLEEIAGADLQAPYFHIHTERPLLLKECLEALADSAGVRLRIVSERAQRNFVDRLFSLKMEEFLPRLDGATQVSTQLVSKKSMPGGTEAWFTVPPASVQDLLPARDRDGTGPARKPLDWTPGFKQKQVLLPDGVLANYYDGGKGKKTLVLLNAYGQSFGYWERLIRVLSARLRIILWIPRGNDGNTIGLRLASPQGVHADDLEQVLAKEAIESCTLLAWCSGPKLALEYYLRYPGRVSSMVFVAGSFKGLQQHKGLETEYEKNLESLLEAIEKYPETAEVVLEYLKGILLAQSKQARSIEELESISDRDLQQALSAVNVSLQELVLHPFYAPNVVAYAKQMRDFWRHDFVAALDKVGVPVLFVGGDCDRIASQAIAKLVAGMISRAKYLEIKGGTHYVHYEQWDLLAQAVEDIVNSGGKLVPTVPWARLTESDQELVTVRQSQA